MSDNETPPIQVAANAVAMDQIAAGARQIMLVVGGLGALLGLLGKRDLVGLIAYLQSQEFVTAALAGVAVGSAVWGQWKARHRAKQVVSVAASDAVPSSVASIR